MNAGSWTGNHIGFVLLGAIALVVVGLLSLLASDPLLVLLVILFWATPAVLFVGLWLWSPGGRRTVVPSTRAGRLSLWLWLGFPAFIVIFAVALSSGVGDDDPDTFFENLYLAIPGLMAGASAIGGGLVAGYAIIFRRERALLTILVLGFGLLVSFFTAGEIGGHEEPGGGTSRRMPTAPSSLQTVEPTPVAMTPEPTAGAPTPVPSGGNSHTNLTIAKTGPREVTVSFDYAYRFDPPRATITAITVTLLGADRQPLAGASPTVRPIGRGTGHMDVGFALTDLQLAALREVSACFTGPNEADLGCAIAAYRP